MDMSGPHSKMADRILHGPVVFLHIPKTAGTSLTQALIALRPWARTLTRDGNITPDMMDMCRSFPAGEQAATLMHGHPLHGTLETLSDAVTMTVLRDPEEQTVSNYLHVRRDPVTPLHQEANTLSFDAFLRRHWPWLVFQNISVDVANSRSPISCQEEFFQRLPSIRALLDRIDFVGTTDNLQAFIDRVAQALGVDTVRIEQLHRIVDFGVSRERIAELRATYRALASEPALQPFYAAEQALYDAARRRPIAAMEAGQD